MDASEMPSCRKQAWDNECYHPGPTRKWTVTTHVEPPSAGLVLRKKRRSDFEQSRLRKGSQGSRVSILSQHSLNN